VLFSIAIALDGVKVQNYFENKEEKFQNLQSIQQKMYFALKIAIYKLHFLTREIQKAWKAVL
jgi:hypothetical protein